MDKILHDPQAPKLWELWYIPSNGSCKILSINSIYIIESKLYIRKLLPFYTVCANVAQVSQELVPKTLRDPDLRLAPFNAQGEEASMEHAQRPEQVDRWIGGSTPKRITL